MSKPMILIPGIKRLLISSILATMTACSSVRNVTDWVPGVDSNEEIQAEEVQAKKIVEEKARIAYEDKTAFAPTSATASHHSTMIDMSNAAKRDAFINVAISQKYISMDKMKREDIGIEVNAGVVTLTGNVDSEESAINAIAIAKNTDGVSRVVSKLIVINLRFNKEG
jgi:osmotically-inducible protein OsmY